MKTIISRVFFSCFVVICLMTFSPVTNSQEPKGQITPKDQKDSIVLVQAQKEVINLLSTWDKNIWFYTSKTNPIKSLREIKTWEDIAYANRDLFNKVLSFQETIGITDTKTWWFGLADPIFTGKKKPPKLYITWSPKLYQDSDVAEANLVGGIRVNFILEEK